MIWAFLHVLEEVMLNVTMIVLRLYIYLADWYIPEAGSEGWPRKLRLKILLVKGERRVHDMSLNSPMSLTKALPSVECVLKGKATDARTWFESFKTSFILPMSYSLISGTLFQQRFAHRHVLPPPCHNITVPNFFWSGLPTRCRCKLWRGKYGFMSQSFQIFREGNAKGNSVRWYSTRVGW